MNKFVLVLLFIQACSSCRPLQLEAYWLHQDLSSFYLNVQQKQKSQRTWGSRWSLTKSQLSYHNGQWRAGSLGVRGKSSILGGIACSVYLKAWEGHKSTDTGCFPEFPWWFVKHRALSLPPISWHLPRISVKLKLLLFPRKHAAVVMFFNNSKKIKAWPVMDRWYQ